MLRNRRAAAARLLAATTALLLASAAQAAPDYPTKPVRFIVPSAAGGTQDIVTRLVAQKMSESLGQAIIVENRVGGDTLVGTRAAKDAPADGYTVLSQANGFLTSEVASMKRLAADFNLSKQ